MYYQTLTRNRILAAIQAIALLVVTSMVFAAPSTQTKSLIIVDEKGKAIEGAVIALGETDRKGTSKVLSTLKSGVDGEAIIPSTVNIPQLFWYLASAPGKSIAGNYGLTSPLNQIVLHPAQTTRIRFVDTKNAPVSGVNVRLSSLYNAQDLTKGYTLIRSTQKELPFPIETQSDAQGWAKIPFGRKADINLLTVEKAGFQTITTRIAASEDEGLTIRLVPDAKISGRILLGATGQPLKNALVEFTSNNQTVLNQSRTDEQGKFQLTGIDEKSGYLRLKSEELVLPARPLDTKRGQTIALGDLKATQGCLVTGTVNRSDKKNLASYFTVLQNLAPKAGEKEVQSFYETYQVYEDGKFSLRLPAGRFTFATNGGGGNVEKLVEIEEGEAVTLVLDVNVFSPVSSSPIAAPQPPAELERPQYLSGIVVDENGKPVPEARVHLYGNEQFLLTSKSNNKGLFALGPLAITGPKLPNSYTLIAEVNNSASSPTIVSATRYEQIQLTLSKNLALSVRTVSKKGEPVPNTTVTINGFRFPYSEGNSNQIIPVVGGAFLPKSGSQVKTDADGMAVLNGLPPGGFVELITSCEGFADSIFVVALPRSGTATLKLSDETIIRGRVTLGGERPVTGLSIQVKTQSWGYPWGERKQWRISEVQQDGTYEIRNVPSLEQIGDSSYTINLQTPQLNIGGKKEVAPGMTLSYVNGWNLMLTIDKDGKKEHWISHVEAGERGIRYTEGEKLNHDMTFQPTAMIKGTLPVGAPRRTISFQDPLSIYGAWRVEPDSQGNFELLVPVGEVTVNFPNGKRQFSGLKPHEVRVVEWDTKPQVPAVPAALTEFGRVFRNRSFLIHVIGPDGATVPRPLIKYKDNRQAKGSELSRYGEMDGTLQQSTDVGGELSLEISSPYLDKPLTLTPKTGQISVTVKLDRMPPAIPTNLEMAAIYKVAPIPQQKPITPPTVVAIGDVVPELQVEKWLQGGPVSLEKLRGRVVVVTSDSSPSIVRLRARYREFPVTFIQLTQSGGIEAITKDANLILGIDPNFQGDWRGYNAKQLGLDNGAALIDAKGRLALSNASEPFLGAKLEQLLENAN